MSHVLRYSVRHDLQSLGYALALHGLIALVMLVNFYWPGKNSNRQIQNVIKAHVVFNHRDVPYIRDNQVKKEKITKPDLKQTVKKEKAVALRKKRAKEKARKAVALKKEREKKKAADAAKKRQQESHKQLLRELAAEEQQRKSQASEAKALSAMAEFEGLIRQRITRNWNQPTGVPAGLNCLVRVRLAAGGDVLAVKIIQSSGNALFDRSVENAVYKAAPLPVPEDPELFKYVREINIRFDPED